MMKKFRSKKHFTTAYSPWSNGTVERVNREVLRSAKALLSEWHLASQYWPAVIDCVPSVLNHAPLKRLGNRKPGVHRTSLEVFTAIQLVRPLLCALPPYEYEEAHTDDEIRARQVIQVNNIQSSLEEMHEDVSEKNFTACAKKILKHNSKTNILPANFVVGDMVLVHRAQKANETSSNFAGRVHVELRTF